MARCRAGAAGGGQAGRKRRILGAVFLVALASAARADPGLPVAPDEPWSVPHIAWLESADGGCGPTFESAAAPINLTPAMYPPEPRPGYGRLTLRVRGIIEASGAVAGAKANRQYPLISELAEQALLASTFAPARLGGQAVPSLVEVVYEFRPEPGAPPYTDTMPDDAELERRAGAALPDTVRAFIAAADSFAIFRLLRDDESGAAGRVQPCPVHEIELKTCGGRYSIPHLVSVPVPLSSDEVARVKDLLLARSPYWVPPRDGVGLKFAGVVVGFDFGLSIRHGGQEMFVLFNLSRAGTIRLRNAQECFGSGHPYRRSTELFCELLERRLGWGCLEREW